MSQPCYLCKSNENDEVRYGKIYKKYNLSVHYYCLLLSSNLVQNGKNDEQGILGFLLPDIRKEKERVKSCRCYICKQMHANVFCCAKKCLRTFHTVCGVKNRCLSHFTGTFQSWCAMHVPLKSESRKHSPDELCSICYEEMGTYDKLTSIRAPCCKNGWFHQHCVARFAQTAGYFFKCPLCNNVDTFMQNMPMRGVFVPERDAAWELEPNAFQEQLVRPSACDAEVCRCTEGRETDNSNWDLLICGSCGSTCRHRECMESMEPPRTYVCNFCRPIVGTNVPELLAQDDDDDADDDDDDDDDGEASSTTYDIVKRVASKEKGCSLASEESGVQCSSSDESTIQSPHRLHKKRMLKQLQSSDSEGSDSSAMVGKRRLINRKNKFSLRRVIIDESEDTDNQPRNQSDPVSACAEQTQCSGTSRRSTINEESNTAQMDEDSNTSGTSSISVGRCGKESFVQSTSRSDSIPLIKRRRLNSTDSDCSTVVQREENELETSNEENIRPLPSGHTKTTPPNSDGRHSSKEKLSSRQQQQQSILQYIIQSSRNASPYMTTPMAAARRDSPAPSSSSKVDRRNGETDRNSPGSECARGATTTTKGKKRRREGNGSLQKVPGKQKSIMAKEKGQVNLLNYFNRY